MRKRLFHLPSAAVFQLARRTPVLVVRSAGDADTVGSARENAAPWTLSQNFKYACLSKISKAKFRHIMKLFRAGADNAGRENYQAKPRRYQ